MAVLEVPQVGMGLLEVPPSDVGSLEWEATSRYGVIGGGAISRYGTIRVGATSRCGTIGVGGTSRCWIAVRHGGIGGGGVKGVKVVYTPYPKYRPVNGPVPGQSSIPDTALPLMRRPKTAIFEEKGRALAFKLDTQEEA
jgi:hypothetical protein